MGLWSVATVAVGEADARGFICRLRKRHKRPRPEVSAAGDFASVHGLICRRRMRQSRTRPEVSAAGDARGCICRLCIFQRGRICRRPLVVASLQTNKSMTSRVGAVRIFGKSVGTVRAILGGQ